MRTYICIYLPLPLSTHKKSWTGTQYAPDEEEYSNNSREDGMKTHRSSSLAAVASFDTGGTPCGRRDVGWGRHVSLLAIREGWHEAGTLNTKQHYCTVPTKQPRGRFNFSLRRGIYTTLTNNAALFDGIIVSQVETLRAPE